MVWCLHRLGRSLKYQSDTLNDLASKGCGSESLNEGLGTAAPGGSLVVQVFGPYLQTKGR